MTALEVNNSLIQFVLSKRHTLETQTELCGSIKMLLCTTA